MGGHGYCDDCGEEGYRVEQGHTCNPKALAERAVEYALARGLPRFTVVVRLSSGVDNYLVDTDRHNPYGWLWLYETDPKLALVLDINAAVRLACEYNHDGSGHTRGTARVVAWEEPRVSLREER